MKRITLAFAAMCALCALTFAGPERYESKNVMPTPPSCDWHGFYIGLNVGVAGLNTTIDDINSWWDYASHTPEDTNFAGGGQVGYNWQRGAFVFGLEADGDYLNTEGDRTDPNTSPLPNRYIGQVDFQGSFRARAGISVDKALIYATAGVALSHGNSRFLSEEEGYNAYQDDWQAGFVAGVGVEYALNCHWSARMEALYSHYPTSTNAVTNDDYYHFAFQNEVWNVRFGINYLFGGP